jgi:molybdopterin synthase catalytic subunit
VTSPSTRLDAVRLVALREEALDVAEVAAAVSDPGAGGVAIFVGAVRDHDHDRAVTRLEYSAHPPAQERLVEVAAEVAAEFDAVGVAAVHRVGTLEIGDLAVVCAVSGAHRGTAFDASRALIDRLKQRVPIWKHQVFADGSDEWVATP